MPNEDLTPVLRQGAIIFARECLKRIAAAVEKIGNPSIGPLADRARETRRQLGEWLED